MPREGANDARGNQPGSPPPGAVGGDQNFGTARSPDRAQAGGPRHQEDVGGYGYDAGPLRPLGRVRGRHDWYTTDQIEHLDRQELTAEINRMKLLSYWEDRSSKAEQEVGKMAPKFEMDQGIPWTDFMVAFKSALRAGKADLLDEHKKRMLYNNLKPKAQRLVGISNVPEEHERKTFVEYYTLLGNVFEPPAESEQMKLEFEARVQQQGEHPQIYYTDKRNLFERAYPVAHRDYEMFFGAVISGLINVIMKEQLRNWVPLRCTAATEIEFAEQIVHKANVLRKRYIAQEISEAECYGAEAMLQSCSYRSVGEGHETTLGRIGSGSRQIKSEPVYALQESARSNRRGGYTDRKCFHCNQTGHYIAQCPRKANGLPAVVSIDSPEAEQEDYEDQVEQEDATVNALGGYYNRQFNPQKGYNATRGGFNRPGNRNRGSKTGYPGRGKPRYQQNRRVAYIYEDENGVTQLEEEGTGNLDPTPQGARAPQEVAAVEDAGQSVNALPEGAEEGDFIPTPFLGGL